MNRLLSKLPIISSSKKGAKWTVIIWLIATVLLSVFAKGANDFATSVNSSGLPNDAKSMVAEAKVKKYFNNEEATPAILVFYSKNQLDEDQLKTIDLVSKALIEKEMKDVKEIMPLYQLPDVAKKGLISESGTTMILPINLKSNLERKTIHKTVQEIEKTAKEEIKDSGLTLKITGPAGIVSDVIVSFSNANFILMTATILLIFILLIVIYRSPLLALIPLIAAGIVHQVVNQTIGIFGENGMSIQSESMSIMSILLFAALTDYALFIVSRYKEELRKHEDKYLAMKLCMKEVSEPIFFSGGTVLAAMLVLFAAKFETYHNFAPIFSIAMVIILLGGLTLLPALFVLLGRKAFWPSIPKIGDSGSRSSHFWEKLARLVIKRPMLSGSAVVLILILLSLNVFKIDYSFNMIKSFPEKMESRQGYERLEKNFTAGELAPTKLLIESSDKLDVKKIEALRQEILKQNGVEKVTPELSNETRQKSDHQNWLVEEGKVAKFTIIFAGNPYDQKTMDQLDNLRDKSDRLLKKTGIENAKLYYAGETAKQADTRSVNDRDTIVIVSSITILITVLLAMQTRSLIAPIYMIITIILSYFTALGVSTFIFENVFGYDAISYRIPVYLFIFLVALGVDYNIMLISRIKEEVRTKPITEAIQLGLSHTGGVISSAGVILAATFAVLMTQPIMELFMFGFGAMIGVLIDTFLVRTILVPAIMVKLGKWSLWPQKVKTH